jgi:glycine/D-amino acid oxidase-like deaminating enzyme
VKELLKRVGARVRTGEMVGAIRREGKTWRVHTEKGRINARAVVFAAPSFLAPYVIDPAPRVAGFVYSPWFTANLTLDRWPRESETPVCWDNVIYKSPALGYVVATHQSLRTRIEKTVWTYYCALADFTPSEGRRALLERDWNWWKEAILSDLEQAHPDIRECVKRVDIMRQGHAMIRPTPGFLSSESRARLIRGEGSLLFANSDLSGLSLFEEALDQGYRAADRALAVL